MTATPTPRTLLTALVAAPLLATSVLALAAGTGAGAPPVSCNLGPDKDLPIGELPGRDVLCVIDAGSKNVKLVVMSMEKGKPATIRDERQCRCKLGLGARAFDSETKTARALAAGDIDNLVAAVREFQAICQRDRGRLIGADATQWARDAKNIEEVRKRLKAETAVDLEVLSPTEEGVCAYRTATFDRPGHVAIDPGSNSFQLSWQTQRDPKPRTVSIPFGYVRAFGQHFASAPDFASAAKAYRSDVRGRIEAALAALDPPATFASLRKAVAGKEVSGEVGVIGQDGAVDLAIRGTLRDGPGKWIADKKTYEALQSKKSVAEQLRTVLTPAEIKKYVTGQLEEADFAALRSDPVKDLYGDKALVVPVLLDLIVDELGLSAVELVPREMPTGYALARLKK